MSLFTAQLFPGQGLGFLVIGASLHDILTRLKAEPQRFPKIDLVYSDSDPINEPIIVTLPANGLRIRFDGPKQQLRLVEAIDFTKNHIFFKPSSDKELYLVRPPTTTPGAPPSSQTPELPAAGPTFRHIYQRFLGPTYNGEFVQNDDHKVDGDKGTYVLSYPGVAFTFPMPLCDFSPTKDLVSLLSSSASQIATSMAIFSGDSWAEARSKLWEEPLPSIRTFAPLSKGRDVCPEEVSHIILRGGGKVQLCYTRSRDDFYLELGKTTPQELVAHLGPPDAIYRKNDQRMHVHKIRAASNTMSRPNGNDLRRQDELTDTDLSSAHTTSEDHDSSDEAVTDELATNAAGPGECFYNYFYLGFDILISKSVLPSPPAPSSAAPGLPAAHDGLVDRPDKQVATKLILHGNIPGSYPFNRHRRCRWSIQYATPTPKTGDSIVTSDMAFPKIEEHLKTEWEPGHSADGQVREQTQRGMVLNRGWGDSPGSSCELLGGWEESAAADEQAHAGEGRKFNGSENSTTTLYGFPGLVFEVLKNGYVSAVTVY